MMKFFSLIIFIFTTAVFAENSSIQPLFMQEQLGMMIFFDTNLSSPKGQSCASCHDPNHAFSDPNSKNQTAKGVIPGRFGNRNVPPIMYAKFIPVLHYNKEDEVYVGGLFLDGRAQSLEEQVSGPLLNPVEMANSSKAEIIEKIKASPYAELFKKAYGENALQDIEKAMQYLAQAVSSFERTQQFSPFSSKYDAYLAGTVDLTPQEKHGLEIFEHEDKGNCAACHISQRGPNGEPPLFTDFTYDNLGVPRNPDNLYYAVDKSFNPHGYSYVDRGLGDVLKKTSELGKFRVPTLRNIALTAPYGHNGYFQTLEGIVKFYNDRDKVPRCDNDFVSEAKALEKKCWPSPEVAANVNKDELGDLQLTDNEIQDLIAFLKTLTDGYQMPSSVTQK